MDLAFWFAVLAPAGTQAQTIAALQAAVERSAQLPEVRQKLGDYGLTVMSSTPEVVEGLISMDLKRYGSLIQTLNIKAE